MKANMMSTYFAEVGMTFTEKIPLSELSIADYLRNIHKMRKVYFSHLQTLAKYYSSSTI